MPLGPKAAKYWDWYHLGQNKLRKDVGQFEAFLMHITQYAIIPSQIGQYTENSLGLWMTLFALPVTIPAAVMTSPIMFIRRGALFAKDAIKQKIKEHQQIRMEKDYQKHEFVVNQKIWKQAVSEAERKLFIQNKKRLVIIQKLPSHSKDSSQVEENQFIVIANEDMKVYDLMKIIIREIKDQKSSIHLMCRNKVLQPSMAIKSIQSDDKGIIKVSYVKIETFG